MHNISFSTQGCRDTQSVSQENINGIEGKRLCEALISKLSHEGWQCEEVIAEDFGWVFFAKKQDLRYFISASVDPDPDAGEFDVEDYAPEGTEMFVNINVERKRSLKQKLIGKNKQLPDDPVTTMLEEQVRAFEDVRNLEVHT